MDVVLYIVAAAILLLLIVFAVKLRGQTEQADGEHRQNVAARAAAAGRPPVAEERGAGMPRRRRGIRGMEHRHAQREDSDQEDLNVNEDPEEAELHFQAAGKVGAKKQRKMEEKQARRAQREAEQEEREERRRAQELREEERRKEEEMERQLEQRREEDEQRAKEEQERREEEEYLRLKESFVIEEQGVTEELTEQESNSLLHDFIQYVKDSKVVLLEDLASHFGLRTQDAISRLQDLMADGSLTGVIDDRGKFIFITPEELSAVANFIRQRGRVSISELAQASNSLINLTPEQFLNIFVVFPGHKYISTIKKEFYGIAGFPSVIGSISGTQIPIKAPSVTEGAKYYFNKKSFHSINVQIICDANHLITNVEAKWPGSVHKSRIFRESPLFNRFEEGQFDGLLLGDGGYPCLPFLMTPYPKPENEAQTGFNAAHSETQATVEETIGILKARFQCLRGLRVSPERACDIIVACAVLHNLAMMRGEGFPTPASSECGEDDPFHAVEDDPDGTLVRNSISQEFL
ncbi:hypothetical protein GJAV_G00049040 [Gymnothorax javanicus]|nr:hypothetical protein GJAV_G00049040 [Gymnothorax javanicus]